MKPFHLSVFVGEVQQQSRIALLALDRLHESTHAGETEEVWMYLQAFLGASANVSKLVFNGGSSRNELRQRLEIDDSSPLADRRLRNHFEHYDERLAAWNSDERYTGPILRLIGPRGSIPNDREIIFWGLVDLANDTIEAFGDKIAVTAVRGELNRLEERARVVRDDLWREGYS